MEARRNDNQGSAGSYKTVSSGVGASVRQGHNLRAELPPEKNRLSALRHECRDAWGMDVALFETFIPQSTAIRAPKDEHQPLLPENEIYNLFAELAKEVGSRLPTFCHVSAPPGRAAKGAVS
jgi:hypothetical protein